MTELRFTGTGALGSHRCKSKLAREYRRFSSLLIDEKIIIDPSEDIFEFEDSFMLTGICAAIEVAFITHSHLGHLSVSAIERLASRHAGLYVFASDAVCRALSGIRGVITRVISPFEIVSVLGYEAMALPSNHTTDIADEICFNYLFKKEKSFFYGLDGGFINPSAFKVLRGVKPDLYIIDCALGNSGIGEGAVYHNDLSGALRIRELLINSAVAAEETRFILSHLPSERRRDIHEELTAALEEYPSVKVAYDGYYITV